MRKGTGLGWLLIASGALWSGLHSVSANAQPVPGEYIRQNAPPVVMPSTPVDDAGRPIARRPSAAPLGDDAILRGAIGQVPLPAAECRIRDDRGERVVSYENGLPVKSVRSDSEVREEQTLWAWDSERVLLLRESWSIRVKQPSTRRGQADTWRAIQWRVENTSWDELGRPLTREMTDGAGQSTRLTCEWRGFRRGDCVLGGVEQADVRLNVKGEVESVSWSQVGFQAARGEWKGTWADSLLTVFRARGTTISSEDYRYDSQGRLERFRRVLTTPRGERTLTWSLRRDTRGNVIEVMRRCEGPCESVRGPVSYRITYDEAMRNTFCGAWWDDGIEPTLRGWDASY